jgi:hypothetical protein
MALACVRVQFKSFKLFKISGGLFTLVYVRANAAPPRR